MNIFSICCVFFTLLSLSHSRHKKYEGCSISFNLQMEEKSPLFLKNNTNIDFIVPVNGKLYLKNDQQFILVCPGPKNILPISNSNQTVVTCSSNNFILARKTVSSEEMQCSKIPKAEIQEHNKQCGGNGKKISIGYKITRKKWVYLIEVCYDSDSGRTLYTEHHVIGEEIENASKTNLRPSFSTAGLGADTPAEVVYKQEFQKSTFNQLLGSARLAEQYINNKSYLARGHLSPDADFLLSPWQYATYFYINTCPQWNSINNGNWKRIENLIRKTASHYNSTLKVITGTHDVLQLPNAKGELVDILLAKSKSKIPVPKFVWKIVCHELNKQCIVLVVVNNPFAQNSGNNLNICNNICDTYGWADSNWNKVTKGLIKCCEYSEFSQVVSGLPNIRVKSVLRGINK
ncbi:unnamed protein product [Brassicogethes aeneus]|uniref:Uncharacterized protein n=1 Tax=Brassicogethes aeneus TaxID=1431903 RepID=A0A9P0B1Q2_BRAAE|nr:unnamed protein product [Brassicogethes aeneus]